MQKKIKSKRFFAEHSAFTLAEVLITLAVIGVVAALTIPTLIQSYKKQVATTRLKKFYSTMEQAIKLSEIDNGPVKSWVKEPIKYDKVENSDDEDANNAAKQKDLAAVITYFDTYIKPYLKIAKIDYTGKSSIDDNKNGRTVAVYLHDGTSIYISNGWCTDFIYDINGEKEPNFQGRDMFRFLICHDQSNISYYGFNDSQPFVPLVERSKIMQSGSISRAKLLQQCKENGAYCSGILIYDNWEFKDDYPYKL